VELKYSVFGPFNRRDLKQTEIVSLVNSLLYIYTLLIITFYHMKQFESVMFFISETQLYFTYVSEDRRVIIHHFLSQKSYYNLKHHLI
jgi:hypothetical protein